MCRLLPALLVSAAGCLLLPSCAPPRGILGRPAGADAVSESSVSEARRIDAIEALIRDGLFVDAQAALDSAIAEGFQHPRAFHAYAMVRFQQGNYQDALAWSRRAIETAPMWPDPRILQARSYLALERPRAASQSFAALEELFPHHPAGPYGRGWIAVLRNQHTEAQEAFAEALQRSPSFAPAIAGQAHIARQAGDGARERTLLRRYQLLEPLDPSIHVRLARLDQEDGLYDSARRGYEHAYQLRPDPTTARALAELANLMDDSDRAAYWQQRSR